MSDAIHSTSSPPSPFKVELREHRVVFGAPVADVLAAELEALNIGRFVLISSPNLATRFDTLAGGAAKQRRVAQFTGVVPHVPAHTIAEAVAVARDSNADGLVAFGGGTAIDTAKGVANELGLPIIAIPTNFSGSEVTWVFGVTSDGVKHPTYNHNVLPRAVIYDPSMLLTLPKNVVVCSGINAIAHAVEALYSPQINPLTQALSETGIRKMVGGLKGLLADADKGARTQAAAECFSGAWLCGEALSQVGMGIHHRISHLLGGTYGLPHSDAHTVMLPYSIAWNVGHVPALAALSDLFPGKPLALGLAEFAIAHGAPHSLGALGFPAQSIEDAAALALRTPVANPRPIAIGDVEAMLRHAHAGDLAAWNNVASA
jgi:maleylacetate reductase